MSSYLQDILQTPAGHLDEVDVPVVEEELPIEIVDEIPQVEEIEDTEIASEPRKIYFSADVEQELRAKISAHNATYGTNVSKRADIRAVRAVYRRGAGAFVASASLSYSRDSWAMARVNAFLGLLASGRPSNASYTYDNDLLPASHAKSAKRNAASLSDAMSDVASATSNSLVASIKSQGSFATPEHAIFALAEYSGLGYEIIPAIRATWDRAVAADENPFQRAYELAANLYSSKDADLLPLQEANNG